MTDVSSGMSLIQRAMQGGALERGSQVPAENTEIRQKEAAHKFGTPPGIESGRLSGDTAPIDDGQDTGAQIEFNPGRCRDERILLPGKGEIDIRNEFRTIKRRLLASLSETPEEAGYPPVVLVTSARPGEGKTFTALNLALTLSDEQDIHVLLIDGDAVNSSLSKYFVSGIRREGLVDLLTENITDFDEVIHQCSGLSKMSVMFSGSRNENTSELMAGPRMTEILSQLHRTYKNLFVVIDCSPVISPEAAALAKHVSHAIFVVAAEQSSRPELQDALTQLSACPQISFVFNKSPRWRKSGSYYQYGYGVMMDVLEERDAADLNNGVG